MLRIDRDRNDLYGNFKTIDENDENAKLDDVLLQEQPVSSSKKDYNGYQQLNDDKNVISDDSSWVFKNIVTSIYILLIILAIITGLLTFAMDSMVDGINKSFRSIYNDSSLRYGEKFIIATIYRLGLLSIALILCYYICPLAIGSGVPELRAISHGRIKLSKYFSLKMLIVKTLSLVMVISTSFPIGKEGPFIHIAAIIASQLNKRIFTVSKRQVFSAACAVGVSACFSAPIGGVLFAIEITFSYFRVAHYLTNFWAAILGFTMIEVFVDLKPTSLELFTTHLENESYSNDELGIFVLEGCLFGLIGSLYVYLHEKWVQFLRKKLNHIHPFIVAFIVCIPLCLCGYWFNFLRLPYRETISDLFLPTSLKDNEHHADWTTSGSIYLSLFMYGLYFFVGSIFMTTLQIPSGVFAPVFACGAGWGRLIGISLDGIIHRHHGVSYAIVGAAASVSGVTQTISSAVIVLELTGELKLAVPILLSCVISSIISNWINEDIYDVMIGLKNIPMLSLKPKRAFKTKRIIDVMLNIKDIGCVTSRMNKENVKNILDTYKTQKLFPILTRLDFKILRGEITRQALKQYVELDHINSLNSVELAYQVNQSPMQVSVDTNLSYIFKVFHALQPMTIYIIKEQEVIGYITEMHLINLEHPNIH